MFRIVINKLFEWLFNKVLASHECPGVGFPAGTCQSWDLYLRWRWSSHFRVVTLLSSVLFARKLESADVLAACRCFADALQVLFGLHRTAVHVCLPVHVYSCMFSVHLTRALGGAMSLAFSTGCMLICRCSK